MMGLTIGVGWLARAAEEEENGDLDEIRRPYELLNWILSESGLPLHREPLHIPEDQIFEAQMWGYGGLHAIRRLAAFQACEGRLPPPGRYEDYGSDPMIDRLNRKLLEANRREGKIFRRWLSWRRDKPKFEHLLWHSDCEGFYLPIDFEHVLFDQATPQREGLGGMVGSSPRLLDECLELAELLGLPDDIDFEADEMWENAQNPPPEGALWQVYGVEAFGLARLIHGCRLSIKNEAVLVFG